LSPLSLSKNIYTFFLEEVGFGGYFCLEDVLGWDYFWVGNFDAKWEESKSGINENWVSSCI
jgi:hypothetical protein